MQILCSLLSLIMTEVRSKRLAFFPIFFTSICFKKPLLSKELSIKNSERATRGEETGHLCNITRSQIARQCCTFLSGVSNKTSLIKFMVEEWKTERGPEELGHKELFATTEALFYYITGQGSEEVPLLHCKQEEAYGRLLLHALHAGDNRFSAVMICSEDTDIFVMSLGYQDEIVVPPFVQFGFRNLQKLIDVSKVANTAGPDVCRNLIGMHAFTGCDSVCAFAGKGKAQALKLVMTNSKSRNTCTRLGLSWDLYPELMKCLKALTC